MSVERSLRRGSLPVIGDSSHARYTSPRFVILQVSDSFMPDKIDLEGVEAKMAAFRELAFQLPTRFIAQIVEEVTKSRLERDGTTDLSSDLKDHYSESWCTPVQPKSRTSFDSSNLCKTNVSTFEPIAEIVVPNQTLATAQVDSIVPGKEGIPPKSTQSRLSNVTAESCHTKVVDQNTPSLTISGLGDRDSQKERRKMSIVMSEESVQSQSSVMGNIHLSDVSAHMIVRQVFPQEILAHLASGGCEDISDAHPSVSVFFSDIVGFTEWCSTVTPKVVCECLSSIFQIIDDLAEQFNVYKVETIGDCWMGVCGAPKALHNHEDQMAKFAIQVQNMVPEIKTICNNEKLSLRCGVHCGPVVSGVVRADRPRWQLFGDTVNTASRMESTSIPGRCQVSSQMATRLQSSATNFLLEDRGLMQVKGKGNVQTFFLNGVEKSDAHPDMVQHLSVLKLQEPVARGLQLTTGMRKGSEILSPRSSPKSREGNPSLRARSSRSSRLSSSVGKDLASLNSLPGTPSSVASLTSSLFDNSEDSHISASELSSAPVSPVAASEPLQNDEWHNTLIEVKPEAVARSSSNPRNKDGVEDAACLPSSSQSTSTSTSISSGPRSRRAKSCAEGTEAHRALLAHSQGPSCGLCPYGSPPSFHELGLDAQTEVKDCRDTVLLVDDQNSVLLQYQRFLRKIPGIKVAIAKNGIQALEKMIPARYSVVFMDINMPEMDGREAIAAFRRWEKETGRERQRVVCLFHTNAYDEEMQGLLDLGFDAVECKSHYKNKLTKHMRYQKLMKSEGRRSSHNSGRTCRPSLDRDPVLAEAYSSIRSFTGNRHILVVDASTPVRRLYERRLLRLDMIVHTAYNAKQALAAMQSHQYLIVFMDLNLPNMTGEECVQAQRKWEMETSNAPQYIVAFFTSREGRTRHEEICSVLSVGFDEAEFRGDSKQSFALFLAKHMGT